MGIAPNSLDQIELVALLKAKSKDGFDYLYDNYSAALMGIALRTLGNRDEAQEAIHDSFLKIWESIESFDAEKGRLFTWMARICKNHCLDKVRSAQYKRAGKTDSLSDSVSATDKQYSASMNTDTIGVKEWMDVLDPDQRTVIQTLYFQGMSQSQAAEELDIPLGTVKTRLRAGLKRIRKKLGVQ